MTFQMLTCAAVVAPRAAPAASDDRTVDVIASTAAMDRHGEVLEQTWRLERYLANPTVLYAHESRELPIGTAENVRLEDGSLRATLRFVSAEANPRAEQVRKLFAEGALRAVSVGFWPHTVRSERRATAEGQPDSDVLVLSDNELLEISVVPVPANPEALAEIRQRALDTTPRPSAREEKTPMEDPTKAADAPTPMTPEESALVAFARQVLSMVHAMVNGGEGEPAEEACTPDTEKALGALRGLVAGRKSADAALAELSTIRAAHETERREKLLVDARADGRLSPAIESSEHWKSIATGSTEALASTLAVLPRAVPTTKHLPVVTIDPTLTPQEKSFARQAGLTDEQMIAEKKRAASVRVPTTTSTED